MHKMKIETKPWKCPFDEHINTYQRHEDGTVINPNSINCRKCGLNRFGEAYYHEITKRK